MTFFDLDIYESQKAILTGVRNGKEIEKEVSVKRNGEKNAWISPVTTKTIYGTSTLYYNSEKDVITTYRGELMIENVKLNFQY